MAILEGEWTEALSPEASRLAAAALASLTPRMLARIGTIAESATAALDVLTSPDVLELLRKMQKAAPTLSALLDGFGGDGPGAGIDGVAGRITAAVASGRAEVLRHPRPVRLREFLRLRKDPAVAAALRFLLGFAQAMGPATRR